MTKLLFALALLVTSRARADDHAGDHHDADHHDADHHDADHHTTDEHHADSYAVAMQKEITRLEAARAADELEAISVAFAKLGDAEHQWLAYYYAALAEIRVAILYEAPMPNGDRIDPAVAKARALIGKAEAIEKNSELAVLTGMAIAAHIQVAPQSRWDESARMQEALETASHLDPGNPRAYLVKGELTLHGSEQFGGGKAKAQPLLDKAVELFKHAKVKPLYPSWGQHQAEYLLTMSK